MAWMTRTNPNSSAMTTTSPDVPAPAIKARPRRRRWRTAEAKAECVALFHESGLSQRDFARQQKMPAANLSRWVRRERKGKTGRTNAEEGPLVELSLPDSANRPGAVAIHVPGGLRLEVLPGTDLAWLGRLLESLRPCSA
jgi:hypothetical protein